MIKEAFFPTIFYAKDIKLDNDMLATYFLNLSKQDPGVHKTNVKGWHSKNLDHSQTEIQPLLKELFDMQKEIYQEEMLDREPLLGNIWANLNPSGGYNKTHMHPNSLWSGVYYIKAPKNSGKLVCNDPRPGVQIKMPVRKEGTMPQSLWREVFIEPQSGRVIMFPSWIWHYVEPNESNDIRISMSFNFIQAGF
jgi:uncharacterized protein (TIGR02466 family)